jgi:hypothetical protein
MGLQLIDFPPKLRCSSNKAHACFSVFDKSSLSSLVNMGSNFKFEEIPSPWLRKTNMNGSNKKKSFQKLSNVYARGSVRKRRQQKQWRRCNTRNLFPLKEHITSSSCSRLHSAGAIKITQCLCFVSLSSVFFCGELGAFSSRRYFFGYTLGAFVENHAILIPTRASPISQLWQ